MRQCTGLDLGVRIGNGAHDAYLERDLVGGPGSARPIDPEEAHREGGVADRIVDGSGGGSSILWGEPECLGTRKPASKGPEGLVGGGAKCRVEGGDKLVVASSKCLSDLRGLEASDALAGVDDVLLRVPGKHHVLGIAIDVIGRSVYLDLQLIWSAGLVRAIAKKDHVEILRVRTAVICSAVRQGRDKYLCGHTTVVNFCADALLDSDTRVEDDAWPYVGDVGAASVDDAASKSSARDVDACDGSEGGDGAEEHGGVRLALEQRTDSTLNTLLKLTFLVSADGSLNCRSRRRASLVRTLAREAVATSSATSASV